MEATLSFFQSVLGLEANTLSIGHIIARSFLIYILGIILVKYGKKRFLGKLSAFDTILAIVIGSLLSRAITSSDYFLEILGACLLLISLHRLFSYIAVFSDQFGNWIKGNERVVIKDGEILWDAMKKSNLSQQDLMQSLRLNARIADEKQVKIARLERNGDISIIMKSEKD